MLTMPERGPECRPSAGVFGRALHAPKAGTPCPQCKPVPAYGRALRAPVPQCRPMPAFGRHSVPPNIE